MLLFIFQRSLSIDLQLTIKTKLGMPKKCKPFKIENINAELKDLILENLVESGAKIEGDNPWDIDLNQHGIKLDTIWREVSQDILISVTDRKFYAKCKRIRKEIRDQIEKARNSSFPMVPFILNISEET